MRLLYCYVAFTDRTGAEKPLRGMKELELNFSTMDLFRFDCTSDTLRRSPRETPLPNQFWANGTETTNIYNINVVAGMNGSGKSTAIQYLMDLLNYIYHGFGKTLSDQERFVRHDPSDNRNVLLFESDEKPMILDLQQGETGRQLDTEGFAKPPLFLDKENAQAILQGMKVINLTNTLTQRDYLLHMGSRNGRLRDQFIYDCTTGATIGPDVGQYFRYEVYKQVKYLFDSRQAEARKQLEETIPELRLPRTLSLRLLEKRFEKTLAAITGMNGSTSGAVAPDETSFPGRLALLCAAAYVENTFALLETGVRTLTNIPTVPKLTNSLRAALIDFMEQAELWLRNILFSKVISGSNDGTLRVWDLATGDCLGTLGGAKDWISCVAVLPDGRIVSGSTANYPDVWDTATEKHLQTLDGHRGAITCVAALPDGSVVSGSYDRTLRVWDPATGGCVQIMKGHTGAITCVAALPDGSVVSGSDDRTLRVWDPATGNCLRTIEKHMGRIRCIAILSDGSVVSGSMDGALRVWDVASGNCLQTLEGHKERINCVAVLPDGRVVSGSEDGTLRVWDVASAACLQTLTLKGHTERIRCVAVLPDGRVVSGSNDGSLRVWDTATGERLRTLKGHTGRINCIAVFPETRKHSHHDNNIISELANQYRNYINYVLSDSDGMFSQFRPSEVDRDVYELALPQAHGRESERLENSLVTFLDLYHKTCTPYYTLDFDWGLSSGEENLLRTFSSLFHVFPRTGEKGDCRSRIRNNPESLDDGGEVCDSVLLIMDEADLTFHPEWQRRLIHILTAVLPTIYPPDCVKDLQLILTTHSPLLLGDIPRENIHFLYRAKEGKLTQTENRSETFGQNIHTILKDSFFLEHGAVGQFAANKIDDLARRLDALRQPELRSNVSAKEMETIRRTIALVAPGVLRAKLEQMLREVEARRERPNVKTLAQQTRLLSSEERQWLLHQLQEEK